MPSTGRDDDWVEQGAFAVTSLTVDLASLNAFRQLLGREVDVNLSPGADVISLDHSRGVGFGHHSAGSGSNLARLRYYDALSISSGNLATYVRTARQLVTAIYSVLDRYRASDLSSAQMVRVLSDSLTAIRAADQRKTDAESRADLHRESSRGGSPPAPPPAAPSG